MPLDRSPIRPVPVGVPAPTEPLGFWASYRTARRNVLELIPEAAYREPILRGGKRPGWIMLTDPDALQRVLKDNEPNYPKSQILIRLMTPREGSNLIISDGEDWRRQRKMMSPVFAARALAAAAPAMTRAAAAAADRIGAALGEAPVDVFPQMIDTTCDVICDVVLSGRESVDPDALTASVNRFIATIGRISILDLMRAPNWVPRPGVIGARRRAMDRQVDRVIADRRARGPSDPADLLDLLIEGAGPDPDRTALIETRNNLNGFLFAGHETTALALTWALYLLALDPAVQERAAGIAQDTLGDRAAGHGDLEALGYHRQIVEEALRLYPPAGFLTRTARAFDILSGHNVAAGMTVILPIYALHRHALLWDAPEAFNPDRFAPEATAARHRFAYLPFGGGPRICIGAGFALMEAQIILATLIARYRFALPQGFTPDPRMWFTLRPGTGMPLVVSRR